MWKGVLHGFHKYVMLYIYIILYLIYLFTPLSGLNKDITLAIDMTFKVTASKDKLLVIFNELIVGLYVNMKSDKREKISCSGLFA